MEEVREGGVEVAGGRGHAANSIDAGGGDEDVVGWDELPAELAQEVFARLPPADLGRVSLVCHAWRTLADDDWVWQRVHRHWLGGPPPFKTNHTSTDIPAAEQEKEEELHHVDDQSVAHVRRGTNVGSERHDPEEDREKEADALFVDDKKTTSKKKMRKRRPTTWREACIDTASFIKCNIERADVSSGLTRWACAHGHYRLLDYILRQSQYRRLSAEIISETDHPLKAEQERIPAPDLSRLMSTAIEKGHSEVVRVLLTHGADPKLRLPKSYNDSFTLIDYACSYGHIEIIEMFLDSGHILDPTKLVLSIKRHRKTCTGTLIHQIAALNCVHFMEALISSTASLSGDATRGEQRAAIIELLSKTDSRGMAPLHYAVKEGYVGMTQQLLRSGADADQLTEKELLTPIAIAITHGRTELVAQLIRSGAQLGPIPLNGKLRQHHPKIDEAMGAIHLACAEHKLEIVEMLLASGRINIESRLADGRTPFLVTLRRRGCRAEPSIALVERFGADVHAKDARGHNAWHYVSTRPTPDKLSLMTWLESKNVEVTSEHLPAILKNFASINDSHPMANAESAAATLRYILRRCYTHLDDKMWYRLYLLAAKCHPRIFSEMFMALDERPKKNAPISADMATRVLAHAVTVSKWTENMKILVCDGGADVNASVDLDEDFAEKLDGVALNREWCRGKQPICFRVSWSDTAMLLALRDLGADVHVRNEMGDTLFAYHLRSAINERTYFPSPSSSFEMARLITWLTFLTKALKIDVSLCGIDLDGREAARWPAWMKTLVKAYVIDPKSTRFPWHLQTSWPSALSTNWQLIHYKTIERNLD